MENLSLDIQEVTQDIVWVNLRQDAKAMKVNNQNWEESKEQIPEDSVMPDVEIMWEESSEEESIESMQGKVSENWDEKIQSEDAIAQEENTTIEIVENSTGSTQEEDIEISEKVPENNTESIEEDIIDDTEEKTSDVTWTGSNEVSESTDENLVENIDESWPEESWDNKDQDMHASWSIIQEDDKWETVDVKEWESSHSWEEALQQEANEEKDTSVIQSDNHGENIQSISLIDQEKSKKSEKKDTLEVKVSESQKLHEAKKVVEQAEWTDRFIIKYKDNSNVQKNVRTLDRKIANNNMWAVEIQTLESLDMGVMDFEEEKSKAEIQTIVKELEKMPEVEYVEPDFPMFIESSVGVMVNDPLWDQLWHLKSISADTAWELYDAPEQKIRVAVNDSGIDYTHPDFSGALVDMSTDCKTYTGASVAGGCAYHGMNFESGVLKVYGEQDTYDINGHGTHVAGIISSIRNNNIFSAWITQNADIMTARMDTYDYLFEVFYMSDTVKALDFAIQNDAKIVNGSYGGGAFSQAAYDAMNRARDAGILFISSAWNDGTNNDSVPHYPSDYDLDNIITVAALDRNDQKASYSNYGNGSIDISAPGGEIIDFQTGEGGIVSLYPWKQEVFNEDFSSHDGYMVSGTGTSWYQYSNARWIHTQSTLNYTWSIDSIITFNDTFTIPENTVATLDALMSCDFWTWWTYDADFGDMVYIYTEENGSNIAESIIENGNISLGRNRIKIPLRSGWARRENLRLKIRFVTDADIDVGKWCWIDNITITNHLRNQGTYRSLQGTSMAAPVVAGVATMVWSYKPDLTYSQVRDILLNSSDQIHAGADLGNTRKVNAEKAVEELIRTYGIQYSWHYDGKNYIVPSINLSSWNLILSWSTLNISSTGSVVNIGTWASISGTGEIYLWKWKYTTYSGSTVWWVGENFLLNFYDADGNTIVDNRQNIYGESIELSYSWSLYGSGTYIQINNETPIILENNITSYPITESFSWTLSYEIFQNGNVEAFVWSNVRMVLDSGTIENISFYVARKEISVNLPSQIEAGKSYPLDMEILGYTGSVDTSYTWGIRVISSSGITLGTGATQQYDLMFSALDSGEKNIDHFITSSNVWTGSISFAEIGTNDMQVEYELETLAAIVPQWNISVVWGNYINSTGANVMITSSEYPVDYDLRLDGAFMSSGALTQTGTVQIALPDIDDMYQLQLSVTDTDSNTTSSTGVIVLDRVKPDIVIYSHVPNQMLEWGSMTLTGLLSDNRNIQAIDINGIRSLYSGTWASFEWNVTLSWAENTIDYTVYDAAWNTTTGSIDIIRTPLVEWLGVSYPSNQLARVSFVTDLESTWQILYGTDTESLNSSIVIGTGSVHTIDITNLSYDTLYYYRIEMSHKWYHNSSSGVVHSFRTPVKQRSWGGWGWKRTYTPVSVQTQNIEKDSSDNEKNSLSIEVKKTSNTEQITYAHMIPMYKQGIEQLKKDQEIYKLLWYLWWEFSYGAQNIEEVIKQQEILYDGVKKWFKKSSLEQKYANLEMLHEKGKIFDISDKFIWIAWVVDAEVWNFRGGVPIFTDKKLEKKKILSFSRMKKIWADQSSYESFIRLLLYINEYKNIKIADLDTQDLKKNIYNEYMFIRRKGIKALS